MNAEDTSRVIHSGDIKRLVRALPESNPEFNHGDIVHIKDPNQSLKAKTAIVLGIGLATHENRPAWVYHCQAKVNELAQPFVFGGINYSLLKLDELQTFFGFQLDLQIPVETLRSIPVTTQSNPDA